MFDLTDGTCARLCAGWSRRDILRVGGLSFLGLTLPDLFRMQAVGAARGDNRKNCIMLMLIGAPPQNDTWDPHPDAPTDVRGPYKPIETNVPGIQVSEILPLTAKHADKYAILRTLHHDSFEDHETGHQVMHTGHFFPAAGGLEFPHIGSVVSHLWGSRGNLPANITLPGPINNTGTSRPKGQDAGFLGKAHNPFPLNADPNKPGFVARDLVPEPGTDLTTVRLSRRRSLREMVERSMAHLEKNPDGAAFDASFQKAYSLIAAPEARAAFDLSQEPDKVRDRYGRTTFGQSCLLARRLVERGVRFVTVNMYDTVFNILCWDCHADGGSLPASVADLRAHVAPIFDRAYSALLEDLTERGLYDDTVTLAFGEFGRTPKLNARGGRDHWTKCWSVALGGGGLSGGQVIGKSDAHGAYPDLRPIHPPEVAATVYRALGIDPYADIPGPSDRPVPIIDRSVPLIEELL